MSDSEAKLREKADQFFKQLCSLAYVAEVLQTLRAGLSPSLTYHSLQHTEDVMREALLFALHDGLTAREMELLGIAAAYHDAGFLQSGKDNEPIGAAMLRNALTLQPHFQEQEIAMMEQLILDTQLVMEGGSYVQRASTALSGYLLDADLSNLGRDDFLQRTRLLMKEQAVTDEKNFLKQTLALLERHQWHTRAARLLRQPTKERNLTSLKATLTKAD